MNADETPSLLVTMRGQKSDIRLPAKIYILADRTAGMNDRGSDAADRCHEGRTTFQRIYDVVLGTQSTLTAAAAADWAACSETGARKALEQLVEMGIVRRHDGRPATYRRNDAYLTWRRVERLADEHRPIELRERVAELIAEDNQFQQRFGVPDPDVVTEADFPDDHDALHDEWEALAEWRTIRRDLHVLRRAANRAEQRLEDGARA